MSFLINALASVFVFSVVIFIHELGHFIVAKKSGIRVNEFSIGMGPKLFSVTKGETDYSVRALPIGGFVAMEGEDEESEAEDSFNKAPVANRIAVVVAGAVMNIILGFKVFTYIFVQIISCIRKSSKNDYFFIIRIKWFSNLIFNRFY